MIKDLTELKAFIQWAKTEGIEHIKIGDIELHFASTTMLNELIKTEESKPTEGSTWAEQSKDEDDEEELLYYSANS